MEKENWKAENGKKRGPCWNISEHRTNSCGTNWQQSRRRGHIWRLFLQVVFSHLFTQLWLSGEALDIDQHLQQLQADWATVWLTLTQQHIHTGQKLLQVHNLEKGEIGEWKKREKHSEISLDFRCHYVRGNPVTLQSPQSSFSALIPSLLLFRFYMKLSLTKWQCCFLTKYLPPRHWK